MKKAFFVIFFCSISCYILSQNTRTASSQLTVGQLILKKLHFTYFGGFSNYQGDLQESFFTLDQSHVAGGLGIAYEINDHFNFTLNYSYGTISANDKYNVRNAPRNLNFTSVLTEQQLGLEYSLYSLYKHKVTPFGFASIAHFHFNPYSYDDFGNKVYLQPLGTEGEGFTFGRPKYKLSQFSLPFGGGLKFVLSDAIRLRVELGFRKTFTDNLDDVSTTYVDPVELAAHNGAEAVILSYRGTDNIYPTPGSARGNPKNKDWYYFSGITISIRLKESGRSTHTKKYKTKCPTNFKFFGNGN